MLTRVLVAAGRQSREAAGREAFQDPFLSPQRLVLLVCTHSVPTLAKTL
jgi:hypothetical protein